MLFLSLFPFHFLALTFSISFPVLPFFSLSFCFLFSILQFLNISFLHSSLLLSSIFPPAFYLPTSYISRRTSPPSRVPSCPSIPPFLRFFPSISSLSTLLLPSNSLSLSPSFLPSLPYFLPVFLITSLLSFLRPSLLTSSVGNE